VTHFSHLQNEELITACTEGSYCGSSFFVICGRNCWSQFVQCNRTLHCCKPKYRETVNSS